MTDKTPTLPINIRLRTFAEVYAGLIPSAGEGLLLEAAAELERRDALELAAATRVEPDGRPPPGSQFVRIGRAAVLEVKKQGPAESVDDFPQHLPAGHRLIGGTKGARARCARCPFEVDAEGALICLDCAGELARAEIALERGPR